MKKLLKFFAVFAVAILGLLSLGSCDEGNGVEVYVVEAKFNSEEVNQWKKLYLLDEDTYMFTVYALDSKDASKVTADFYMGGSYTREGNVVTIQPGYGWCKALNGDTPIEMPVTGGGPMYAAMAGTTGYVFTLDLENMTFTISE